MKKTLAILLGISLVLFVSGIVYAAEDEVTTTGSTAKGLYGQCVSENALLKNSCFAATKTAVKGCKSTAKGAKDKDASKQCKLNYKAAKKQWQDSIQGSKSAVCSFKEFNCGININYFFIFIYGFLN